MISLVLAENHFGTLDFGSHIGTSGLRQVKSEREREFWDKFLMHSVDTATKPTRRMRTGATKRRTNTRKSGVKGNQGEEKDRMIRCSDKITREKERERIGGNGGSFEYRC
jgi:hypothetical protein